MSTWQEFSDEVPDLAATVRERFDAYRHKTMATLRADGSPRISGVEVSFHDGELWLGGMPGARKSADLRRDPRVAIHSGSADPPDDPSAWRGDAKVAGRAIEVDDEAVKAVIGAGGPPGPFDLFRVDLSEAVVVRVGEPADHLVIESWHAGRGYRRVRRS